MDELKRYRDEIDRIDSELLALFLERMDCIKNVARYKAENGLDVQAKAREREILLRANNVAGEERAAYARVFFTTLMDISRNYQVRLMPKASELVGKIREAVENTPQIFPASATVACQGVEGAFSQQACDRLFAVPDILYFRNFEGVFQAVERGLCGYGVLPIENSSYGSVNEVYDLMQRYNFHIVRSLKLQVRNALLARPGAMLSGITEIFSHEQAIGQCDAFLKAHPNIKITECENTAVAARHVAESGRTDVAALAAETCAELYGLSILPQEVMGSDYNYTRFICIAKNMQIYPGATRISLMLSLPHVPGSVYTFISKFAARGLNLVKLESRPVPGRDFSFLFYFDVEASVYSEDVLSMLGDLERSLPVFEFLGSYSEV